MLQSSLPSRARGCGPTGGDGVVFEDLEDENADLRMALAAASAEIGRLRSAIETFILWWDMPPYVLDDDDGLRGEVDALREVIK